MMVWDYIMRYHSNEVATHDVVIFSRTKKIGVNKEGVVLKSVLKTAFCLHKHILPVIKKLKLDTNIHTTTFTTVLVPKAYRKELQASGDFKVIHSRTYGRSTQSKSLFAYRSKHSLVCIL